MLDGETDLVEELSFDSLARVELVMALENVLQIQIGDKDGDGVKTLGDLVKLCHDLIGNRSEPSS